MYQSVEGAQLEWIFVIDCELVRRPVFRPRTLNFSALCRCRFEGKINMGLRRMGMSPMYVSVVHYNVL